MKQAIITALSTVASFALGVSTHAQGTSYKPTMEQVAMYGGEGYVEGEIVASEADGVLMFVFNGEPIADKNKKVIQIYCQVWDLKPGKYKLTVQMKSGGGELDFPLCLDGKPKADETKTVKLADYLAPKVRGEWQEVVLPVEVTEAMLHGYFIMRVGGIAKGSELHFNPEFKFSPAT